MNIIEKDLNFLITGLLVIIFGVLNFVTFKKFDSLNLKFKEIQSTHLELKKSRKRNKYSI